MYGLGNFLKDYFLFICNSHIGRSNLDFIAYNCKSCSELNGRVKHFTKTDFSDLVESHARAIALYLKKDEDIFRYNHSSKKNLYVLNTRSRNL